MTAKVGRHQVRSTRPVKRAKGCARVMYVTSARLPRQLGRDSTAHMTVQRLALITEAVYRKPLAWHPALPLCSVLFAST